MAETITIDQLSVEGGVLTYLWDDPNTPKKKTTESRRGILIPLQSGSGVSAYTSGYKQNILNDIIKKGQIGQLKELLKKHFGYTSGKIDDDFDFALEKAINAASVFNYYRLDAVGGFQGKKALSLIDYLKNRKEGDDGGSGGYTGPTSQTYITGKPAAKDKFRDIVNQLTGKSPNKEDFEEFYDLLVKAQKRYVNKQSGQHHQTVIQNPFDLDNFTLRYVVKKLSLTDDMSGTAGAVQDLIEQTIRDYGLNNLVGAGTKAKLIKGLLKGKLQESDIDDTFRNLAKATYSAFADDLDRNPNISFQDIISPYVQMYNNMLEKTGLDTDISKVLSMATQDGKKMTIGDFQKALMKSQDYQMTSRAKSDASTLAASFARAFGVNV